MRTKYQELKIDQMLIVTGGTVNDNCPHPSDFGDTLDEIINGQSYEAIAQYIADYFNGDNVRSRELKSDIDIYDCEI